MPLIQPDSVIPAKAGIQEVIQNLDPRLRGDDKIFNNIIYL
jgi:hypothetical protein